MRNETPKPPSPKKTVSIEVRVSEEDKHAFLEACRIANRSASAVLRRLMGVFVSLQRLRPRSPAMLTRFFLHPARAAVTALALTGAVTAGIGLTPGAAAEVQLAYQVAVADDEGRIVSHGVADLGRAGAAGAPSGDRLGPDVRFTLEARTCTGATPDCPAGASHVLLRVWDSSAGETVTASGVVVGEAGETRYDARLDDGRRLEVILAPRAPA
jgi:hypothetical protein